MTRYCVCDEAEPVMLDITSLFFRMIPTIRNQQNLAHAKAPLFFCTNVKELNLEYGRVIAVEPRLAYVWQQKSDFND